jgi:hypothetical protein
LKKLLYIEIFFLAITANATEKKGVATNSLHEKVVVKDYSNEILADNFKDVNAEKKISMDDIFFGCGSEGNAYYSMLRMEGMGHRDARTSRRAYVRKCRNYFWQFGIF